MLEKWDNNPQPLSSEIKCYRHPKLDAIAKCSRCGKPVCKNCYLDKIKICTKCRNRIVDRRSFAFFFEILIPIFILYFTGLKRLNLLVYLYLLLKDGFKGQSLLKRVFKLKVIDTKTGKPCRIWQSCLRNIIFFIPVFPIIEYIMITHSPNLRRLGDRIAGTKVIEIK